MTKRFGFTLAEVLITLTIIGVIAAMTIPTLMSNTSEQEYKTGLKKAISTLNQAITMQYALEGTDMSEYTATGRTSTSDGMFGTQGVIGAVFAQRMQVVDRKTSRPSGKTTGDNAAIYLSDGMVIEFPDSLDMSGTTKGSGLSTQCTKHRGDGCLYTIVVDLNGDKGKCSVEASTTYDNAGKVHAKDCFPLDVYRDGVRPANFAGRAIMYEGK